MFIDREKYPCYMAIMVASLICLKKCYLGEIIVTLSSD